MSHQRDFARPGVPSRKIGRVDVTAFRGMYLPARSGEQGIAQGYPLGAHRVRACEAQKDQIEPSATGAHRVRACEVGDGVQNLYPTGARHVRARERQTTLNSI